MSSFSAQGRTTRMTAFTGAMFESLELTKGQTPDRPVDSLGGSVNFKTRSPLSMREKRRLSYNFQYRTAPSFTEQAFDADPVSAFGGILAFNRSDDITITEALTMSQSDARCPGQDLMFYKPEDIYDVQCPSCGKPVEFWKDDARRICKKCGKKVDKPGPVAALPGC